MLLFVGFFLWFFFCLFFFFLSFFFFFLLGGGGAGGWFLCFVLYSRVKRVADKSHEIPSLIFFSLKKNKLIKQNKKIKQNKITTSKNVID